MRQAQQSTAADGLGSRTGGRAGEGCALWHVQRLPCTWSKRFVCTTQKRLGSHGAQLQAEHTRQLDAPPCPPRCGGARGRRHSRHGGAPRSWVRSLCAPHRDCPAARQPLQPPAVGGLFSGALGGGGTDALAGAGGGTAAAMNDTEVRGAKAARSTQNTEREGRTASRVGGRPLERAEGPAIVGPAPPAGCPPSPPAP